MSESGDTPVTKKFTMRVVIEERVFEGLGTSKKLAKQAVLRIRIHMFLGLLDPDPDPSVRGTVWIRIHRIHMFLGLLDPDPDPSVRGMDPDPDLDPDLDPSVTKQKKVRKTLIPTAL